MESLLPLALFAFVSSITPGPNNIMLTSSGILFGFARTLPHMLGITVGFGLMLGLCAAGIGSVILTMPWLHALLKLAGSAYLLYLAWQLRSMSFRQDEQQDIDPMSFVGAAGFQFLNPKAWVMAITGASAFLPPVAPVSIAVTVFCVVFCLINFCCISVWAGAGAALRRYLQQPVWQKAFCWLMVVLTIYAAVSLWL